MNNLEVPPREEDTLRLLDGTLTKLQLAPGDVVVFMTKHILSMQAGERIKSELESLFPGHQCVCLGEGDRLGAITPARNHEATHVHA